LRATPLRLTAILGGGGCFHRCVRRRDGGPCDVDSIWAWPPDPVLSTAAPDAAVGDAATRSGASATVLHLAPVRMSWRRRWKRTERARTCPEQRHCTPRQGAAGGRWCWRRWLNIWPEQRLLHGLPAAAIRGGAPAAARRRLGHVVRQGQHHMGGGYAGVHLLMPNRVLLYC
jgi:hypothetical protein